MTTRTTRRLAAATMAAAALLAIAGFTALGSVFDYPQILKSPTADILGLYRRHQGAVTSWFGVLMVSAALLAPAGILLGRLAGGSRGRWIARLGVVAAAVQVTGLSRWVLLVPGISRNALDPTKTADAHRSFELVHTWLGTVLGETIGYALTAAFTVLITLAVTRSTAPRWMTWLGYGSAALIATGVVIPLGLEAGQPDQLRRLRRLVPLAARHGRFPLAPSARHLEFSDRRVGQFQRSGHPEPVAPEPIAAYTRIGG
jgi:hypothetical protein